MKALFPAPGLRRASKGLLGLVLILGLNGCSTVITREADEAVLRRVAEKADGKFSVFWHGEDRLHLRNTNWWMSTLVGGWNTFHADLRLQEGVLRAEFYGRMITPLLLFIPISTHVDPPVSTGHLIGWAVFGSARNPGGGLGILARARDTRLMMQVLEWTRIDPTGSNK